MKKIFADGFRKQVDSVAAAVESQVVDAILTVMDSVVVPNFRKAARSITESSRRGSKSVVQNPENKVFSGNMEDTPLMRASSCTDLIINYNRNDETQNSENVGDGNFPGS